MYTFEAFPFAKSRWLEGERIELPSGVTDWMRHSDKAGNRMGKETGPNFQYARCYEGLERGGTPEATKRERIGMGGWGTKNGGITRGVAGRVHDEGSVEIFFRLSERKREEKEMVRGGGMGRRRVRVDSELWFVRVEMGRSAADSLSRADAQGSALGWESDGEGNGTQFPVRKVLRGP
ncbi:hypothetical protein R3P38DRAFT_2764078 [Favolaschia claudopus]|uniref:Uncharacterized protein n=1 Tax=Favolaschia claudopus TaxID=2862362 RepID=A0AAW0D5V2_9AGAR